ncbi:hypothetical protein BKA80DRAFT_280755 [Phyllosticta citrichinensis]
MVKMAMMMLLRTASLKLANQREGSQRSSENSLGLGGDVDGETRDDGETDAQLGEDLQPRLRVRHKPVGNVQTVAQEGDELTAGQETLDGARPRVEEPAIDAHKRVGVEDVVVHVSVHSARSDDGKGGTWCRGSPSRGWGNGCRRVENRSKATTQGGTYTSTKRAYGGVCSTEC